VADKGAQKIFRYRLTVQPTSDPPSTELQTDGIQVTVVQDALVEWVTVDISGDVLYTDQGTNTINRIPLGTIDALSNGDHQAGDIVFISEKQQEATAAALLQQELTRTAGMADPAAVLPNARLEVYRVYEGSINPHVTVPAGIASDGVHLFWANQADGLAAGAAVRGEVHPRPTQQVAAGSSPAPFAAVALANNTDEAYGVAKSNTVVFFSSNNSGIGSVYGVLEGQKHVHSFVGTTLVEPRGLVWDGDQTVYVADRAAGVVWSFPVGLLVENAPLTKSAVVTGAYGVALISDMDHGFQSRAGSRGPSRLAGFLAPLAACLSAAAA